jgi:pimeloyl-ACP methyl ester carboxylesterase
VSGQIGRRTAHVNGIEVSYLTAGEGPLVVFMHGFPDLAISWKHQLQAVAEAGYRGVALDMRGYGGTSAPEDPEAYSQFHVAGDVAALMDELGEESAVLVGHDMGANLAWAMASFLPQRVRGVAVLSIPHKPRGDQPPVASSPPTFYQRRFQPLGVEEELLHAAATTFLTAIFDRLSGSSELGEPPALLVPEGRSFRDLFEVPTSTPAWLGDDELAEYVATFQRTGFRGALNWYRNIDRNWYQSAPWAGLPVTVPATFIIGTGDVAWALFHANGVIDSQKDRVPLLTEIRVLDGVGHWIAQEAPAEVNDFLLTFLTGLDEPLT